MGNKRKLFYMSYEMFNNEVNCDFRTCVGSGMNELQPIFYCVVKYFE